MNCIVSKGLGWASLCHRLNVCILQFNRGIIYIRFLSKVSSAFILFALYILNLKLCALNSCKTLYLLLST